MQVLTDEGQQTLADIARRHGVSSEAASQLLSAIAAGGGRQAQFNHPELGGMGQWSQGGMTMIGDMFNQGLKARVAGLCSDLAELWHSAAAFAPDQPQPWNSSSDAKSAEMFMQPAFGHRWPAELGAPTATGSQNDMHYAIFPGSRRLAIERGGQVTVYDTGDHRIGGVSQQQGSDQSLRLTSQSGVVSLSELKIVGAAPEAEESGTGDAPGLGQQAPAAEPSPAPAPSGDADEEIFSRLERLADLCSREIITAEEFAAKKAELLARL
jgi:hypothetical protein